MDFGWVVEFGVIGDCRRILTLLEGNLLGLRERQPLTCSGGFRAGAGFCVLNSSEVRGWVDF